jgi:glyoxylase-like metal-dependent hydrolase (beta-lactamase superfamily II)
MTLEGTNTWVLREPHAARSVVVDPGPDNLTHLRRVAAVAGPVAVVLLTHGHVDHAGGAKRFADLVRAPVRALDRAHRLGEEGLGEGEVVAVD